ncbi:ubiquinol-cytochrome-c reductase complex assembly factor 1, putative [Plasmodium relictum]|uniref:Ubiquinol-cytochrome-c reductase complex assembly factor 1, putative n=1 Tax=Plasmodium relictum TaxID=85471 RepID=A0A1J1H1E3_PLARL|nr:ubiquinol-cytochrome-c reductase complex assembly factor 1, putative [Plasmodium relictum]CRG98738.1 ubiquinol-cytochrome-c reductase complex assembly factor 1, putative [Plasmodium relictum]
MWNKGRSLLLNRRYKNFRYFVSEIKVYDSLKIIESKQLYEDRNTKITVQESSKYAIPIPQCDRSIISSFIYKIFLKHTEYGECAWRLIHLIIERLENEEMIKLFRINESFNMKMYFYVLHLWIINKRLRHENYQGDIINTYIFDITWRIVRDWLLLKNIPEYTFNAELLNCQEYAFGFLVSLDEAASKVDIFPSLLKDILWEHLYEKKVKKGGKIVTELSKYSILQLRHIFNISSDYFLQAYFIWADFYNQKKSNRRLPALSQQISYGGYRPKDKSKYLPYDDGKKLLPRIY